MDLYVKKQSSGLTIPTKPTTLYRKDYHKMAESTHTEPVKLALFDLDDTLIKPKSHNRFSKSPKDWIFKFNTVQSTLKKLQQKRYKIFIITNQLGIGKGYISVADFEAKLNNIVDALNVNITVLAATQEDEYRKPFTGSWNYIVNNIFNNHNICSKNSFYVGDAAGRGNDIDNNRIADHSNCDLLFAENAGLKFYTPEMYFENHIQDFEPTELKVQRKSIILTSDHFCQKYFKQFNDILLVVQGSKVLSSINNTRSFSIGRVVSNSKNIQKIGGKSVNRVMILVNGPPNSGKSHLIDFFFNNHYIYSWVT